MLKKIRLTQNQLDFHYFKDIFEESFPFEKLNLRNGYKEEF